MVEQERQEGMTAPTPETKFQVLETTLAELGVDTSFDNLNLAGDRITFGLERDGNDTVFVGFLHHPFANEHFAQYLNSIAPFGDQDRQGIIDDINLPILAERDYRNRVTSENTRLHERHLGDPRVEAPYKEFAKYHASSWLKALESKESLDIFWVLKNVKFINNLKTFTDHHYFSGVEELMFDQKSEELLLPNYLSASGLTNIGWHMLNNGSRWGCGDFKSLFYDMRGLEEIDDVNKLFDEYRKLSVGEEIELIRAFFERNSQSKQEFVLKYLLPSTQALVDLENNCLYGEPIVQAKLVDVETLELKDDKGTQLLVAPDKNTVIPGGFGWRIKKSRFSREYTDSAFHPALFPAWAWRKAEDGTRSFLTQEEAMPLIAELGLPEGEQGDVKLGEIGVGYFSRHIIKKWPESMALKPLEGAKPSPRGDDFKQPMGGAQMPAWVGIEVHEKELLSDNNPFWQIENRIKVAA